MAASKIDQKMSKLNAKFQDLAGETSAYYQAGIPRNIVMIWDDVSFLQYKTGVVETECETIEGLVSSLNDTDGVTAPRTCLMGAITEGDRAVRSGKTWYLVDLIGGGASGMQRLKFCTKQFNPDRI